jgi:hypothetical protein
MELPAASLTRQQIIDTLHQALRASPAVHAAWLGGSDATGRTDHYSDIDCQVLADDEAVESVFTAVAAALNTLSPLVRQYRIPEPTWHGHSQTFYRLQDAPAWLLVDFAVLKMSSSPAKRFLEPERHGHQLVLFDDGGLVQPIPFDRPAHEAAMRERLTHLAARFELFHVFVDKAIWRQDAADAISAYHAITIRSLVELLRMRYCPDRYDFGLRYLDRDLPSEIRQQVEPLLFCGSLAELADKQATAVALFQATLNDLSLDADSDGFTGGG